MSVKVGDYIKEEWKHNSGYRSTWVRRIDRETKTQFVSNCNRGMKPRTEPTVYVFPSYGTTKFIKTPDFIKSSVTQLSNPDGHTVHTVIKDFKKDLLCKYSYDELFETDVRELQKGMEEHNNPVKMKLWRLEKDYYKNYKNWDEDKYFKISFDLSNVSEKEDHWNKPLVDYLEETFGVPVYNIWNDKVREHNTQGKLCESMTLMHVNHFGGVDKKKISREENECNRTIGFWLFEDRIIFQDEDGKDTW